MTELSDKLRRTAKSFELGGEDFRGARAVLQAAADKVDLLDRLREVAECPPDCGLEDWIKILVNCWHDECEARTRGVYTDVKFTRPRSCGET